MMKRLLVFAVLVVAFIYSAPSYAQGDSPNLKGAYIGIGGSIAFEDFDFDFPDPHKSLGCGESWGIDAKAGYYFNSRLSLELDFNYLFKFEGDGKVSSSGTTADGNLDVRIFTIMPVLKVSTGASPINPFFAVGLGYMNVKKDYSETSSISPYPYTVSEDESDFGAKLGLGIDYFASNNLSIGLEADYIFGMGKIGMGGLDDVAYWDITLGICYYFGMGN